MEPKEKDNSKLGINALMDIEGIAGVHSWTAHITNSIVKFIMM